METTLENAAIISIVGFSTVMVCLIGFAIIISIVNKLSVTIVNYKQSRVQSNQSTATTSTPTNGSVPDIDLAIITAAITSTMGDKVRINKISFLAPVTDNTAWAQMSKVKKFEGHNIIQKRRVNYEK